MKSNALYGRPTGRSWLLRLVRLSQNFSRALLGLVLMLATSSTLFASTLPTGFAETRLATGLDPAGMEVAPDGRLFVLEKSGKVRIIKNGALLTTPFLTISVDNNNERGLLGIAFDPNFATNQYIYLYYTVPGTPPHNRVSRFTANGDVAVAGSETIVLELDDLSAGNHNGGNLFFKDGKLFIATGENAVPSKAQSMTSLLGKFSASTPTAAFLAITLFTLPLLATTGLFGHWGCEIRLKPPFNRAPAAFLSTTWAKAAGKK